MATFGGNGAETGHNLAKMKAGNRRQCRRAFSAVFGGKWSIVINSQKVAETAVCGHFPGGNPNQEEDRCACYRSR